MKKSNLQLLFPLIFLCIFVLLGCEDDHFHNHENVSRLNKVAPDTSSRTLETDTTASICKEISDSTATHLVTKSKNKTRQSQLDTAIAVLDYRDSIAGGKEKTDSTRNIDIIIIHSSYYVGADTFSVKGIIKQFQRYGVSAHYLLGRGGEIYRLVDENDISYHAGESRLPANKERQHLNDNSIGIEVMSTESIAPTAQQYATLTKLVNNIRARHTIKYIYRHSDIAPGRKTDPWSFDWTAFLERLKFHNPAPETGNIDVNEEIDEIIKQDNP